MSLKKKKKNTFADYATQHIVPFLEYQITPTVERIDAIRDNYPEGNLKSLTHQRRGTGLRTRIGDGHTQIPKHEWNSGFLKNEGKKKSYSLSPVKRLDCQERSRWETPSKYQM